MLRRSLALAAMLCLACGIAAAQTFSGALSGSWWDPARSGEGQFITFETVGTRNVAYFAWFTYSATGGASWLVGNADYTPGATSITMAVFTGAGGELTPTGYLAGAVPAVFVGVAVLALSALVGLLLPAGRGGHVADAPAIEDADAELEGVGAAR